MKPSSAIKTDLFADEHHRKKIDSLGDPLADIESHIDFASLAAEVDEVAPCPVSAQGGRPPRNAVVCKRNWVEFGGHHHCAAGLTENLGLFEVSNRHRSKK